MATPRREQGRVWFGALGWSGSWRLSIEQTSHQQVRVTGGFNPFDFGYRLEPGESLESPPFYAGFTEGGIGEASRILHRFERLNIMPGGASARLRPVLYNSWEATEFAVDEPGQKALAAKAAKLGVERFVMDDGWFGARNNDHAGLGDWTVNPQKFPNGLTPLIDYVNGLGMDFGLWVEPEMVNPDSNLYRQHPDWAMHFPDRPRTEQRNQLVLNMARDDVKNYIFGVLDRLLAENPKIAFLKWDMNRNFSEPGWPEAPVEHRRRSGSLTRAMSMTSSTGCAPSTRSSKSKPAQAAAGAWTWESSAGLKRYGLPITPTPSTACESRKGSATPTRRKP